MKKLSILFMVIFIFGLSTAGDVSAENVLFEGIFERGNTTLFESAISSKGSGSKGSGHNENGKPVTQVKNFSGSSGEATLKVCNGVDAKKISSAIISINGNDVLGSSTFNQNVGCIEKMVNLDDGNNILAVQLKSEPGGKVSIEISQLDGPSSCDECDDTDGYPNVVIDIDPDTEGIQGIPVGNGPSGVLATETFVYVTNYYDDTVSVIDTANNEPIDFDLYTEGIQGIPVGHGPYGISVTPYGEHVYVTNYLEDTVSVIDTTNNTPIDFDPDTEGIQGILVGDKPSGVLAAETPYGEYVYVTNYGTGSVSVIHTGLNEVIAEITVGSNPLGVSVMPGGEYVYVTNYGDDTVSVIDTANNEPIDFDPDTEGIQGILVGDKPSGISVTGAFAYVTNFGAGSVSVIDTGLNEVIAEITVGSGPFGISATPGGGYVYVNNFGNDKLSVIDTSNNTVIDTDTNQDGFQEIQVGDMPYSGIAVSPNGNFVYVGNYGDDTVSVIGF